MPGGEHQRDQVAVESALARRLRRGGDLALAQAVELGGVVDDDGELVRVGEQVLLEPGGEAGEALVVLAQRVLVVVAEACACDGELGEAALHQVARLGVEAELVEPLVHGGDPRVERGVQADGVAVRRVQRGDLLLELVRELGAVAGALVVEDGGDPAQGAAAALERHQGVREAGRLRVLGDALHLGELLREALVEGGPVVLLRDLGEGRELERQVAGGEERIRHLASLGRNARAPAPPSPMRAAPAE